MFTLEPQLPAASQSAAAVGQPVTFIGQPGIAFQPIGKVCSV